jgi:hypothetical protein
VIVELHLMANTPGNYRVGSPAVPVVTSAAAPVDWFSGGYDLPDNTMSGIVCGDCTRRCAPPVRHATVSHVRACGEVKAGWEAEARAEALLVRAGIL